MDHPQHFRRFIEQIRPTPSFRQQLRLAHLDLTRRLLGEPRLKPHIVSTFLQGSYRRSTSIRAARGKGGSDVDLVLVTRLDPDQHSPERLSKLLTPFLRRHYGTWRAQGRSYGIDLGEIHLDLVIASAPSQIIPLENESSADSLEETSAPTVGERNAWSSEPLRIPDRNTRSWRSSHPLAQLAYTRDKNSRCGQHYINVVRAIKWWALHTPGMPEHPKGYPLERLVEECCPDGIESIAEGLTLTFETIATRFSDGRKPRLVGHGLPGLDVLARVPKEDFAAFARASAAAAQIARAALDSDDPEASARAWRELLGPEFPEPAASILSTRAPTNLVSLDREDGFFAQLRERRDLFVRGMEDINRVKRTLERAIEQLGLRIEYAPESPPELLDYLGVMGLTAARGAVIGGTIGLAIGALVKDPKPWTALGAFVGAMWGLYQGQQRVHAGWRLQMGYDEHNIPWLVLKALPAGS